MRQLPVLLRQEAWDDLWSIGRYLGRNGASEAIIDGFIDRIEQRCHSIGNAPEGYPKRDDIGSGLRAAPFERSALIVYRIESDTVQIINVYYGGRDYAR